MKQCRTSASDDHMLRRWPYGINVSLIIVSMRFTIYFFIIQQTCKKTSTYLKYEKETTDFKHTVLKLDIETVENNVILYFYSFSLSKWKIYNRFTENLKMGTKLTRTFFILKKVS